MRARLRQGGGIKKQDRQKASALHARVHGEVEDMQQATDAERIYSASRRHHGVCNIFYPALLLLRLMLLLLVIASGFVVHCTYINNQIYS